MNGTILIALNCDPHQRSTSVLHVILKQKTYLQHHQWIMIGKLQDKNSVFENCNCISISFIFAVWLWVWECKLVNITQNAELIMLFDMAFME
jgi:hypothetical protein